MSNPTLTPNILRKNKTIKTLCKIKLMVGPYFFNFKIKWPRIAEKELARWSKSHMTQTTEIKSVIKHDNIVLMNLALVNISYYKCRIEVWTADVLFNHLKSKLKSYASQIIRRKV
jgi:hypothetical protein